MERKEELYLLGGIRYVEVGESLNEESDKVEFSKHYAL